MTEKIIECIANFSEGQNPEIIQGIIRALLSVKNIQILDKHSDIDHNRTVVTFVGPPADVQEAAFQAIKVAGRIIDLEHHKGSHPRIGATDVVPLVPISGISMEECIQISKTLAEKVGRELNIPVYLYEESALFPERRNLEKIRKGEYELLKTEIQTNPSRVPDFGPSKLTPAGATVIGARYPLITFTMCLSDSADLEKARIIAKKYSRIVWWFTKCQSSRYDGWGFSSSIHDLTNYRETSIHRVMAEIISESKKINVKLHHSELVGLVPRDALIDYSIESLVLQGFKRGPNS